MNQSNSKRKSVVRKRNLTLARERQQRHMARTGATELVRKSMTLKLKLPSAPMPQQHSVRAKENLCGACGHPGFVRECGKCGFEGDGIEDEERLAWPPSLDDLIQEAREASRQKRAAKRKKAARFLRTKRRAARRAAERSAKKANHK